MFAVEQIIHQIDGSTPRKAATKVPQGEFTQPKGYIWLKEPRFLFTENVMKRLPNVWYKLQNYKGDASLCKYSK